jgi:GTP cyclohydrolase I
MQTVFEPQSLVSASLQELTKEMLVRLGEDPERDGLRDTPERMERSMRYLTKGYEEDPEQTLRDAMFDVAYDEMVIVKISRCSASANTTFCRFSARSTSLIFRKGR